MTLHEPKTDSPMRGRKIWLDDETDAAIEEICALHAISRSSVVRIAVRNMRRKGVERALAST